VEPQQVVLGEAEAADGSLDFDWCVADASYIGATRRAGAVI